MIGLIALSGLARSVAKPIEAKREYDLKLGYQTELGKRQSIQELATAKASFKLTKDLEHEYFMSPEGTQMRKIEGEEILDHKKKELALETADWINREVWKNTEAVDYEIGRTNRILIGTKNVSLNALLENTRALNIEKLNFEVKLLEGKSEIEIDTYIEKELRSIRELTGPKLHAEYHKLKALEPLQLAIELRKLKAISGAEHRLYLDQIEAKSGAERQEWLKDKLIEYHPEITQKEIQTQLNIMNKLTPREIAFKLTELKTLFPETFRQEKETEEMKHKITNSDLNLKPSGSIRVVVGDGENKTEKKVDLYSPHHPVFQHTKKEYSVRNGFEWLNGLMQNKTIDAIFESGNTEEQVKLMRNIKEHFIAYRTEVLSNYENIQKMDNGQVIKVPNIRDAFSWLREHPVTNELGKNFDEGINDQTARDVLNSVGIVVNVDPNKQIVKTFTEYANQAQDGHPSGIITYIEDTDNGFTPEQRKTFYDVMDWRIRAKLDTAENLVDAQLATRFLNKEVLDFYGNLMSKEFANNYGLAPLFVDIGGKGGFLKRLDQFTTDQTALSQKEIRYLVEAGRAAGFNTAQDYIEALSVGVQKHRSNFAGGSAKSKRFKSIGLDPKDIEAKQAAAAMLKVTLRAMLSTMTQKTLDQFAYTSANKEIIDRISPLPYATDLTSGPLGLFALFKDIIPRNIRIIAEEAGYTFDAEGRLDENQERGDLGESKFFEILYQNTYGDKPRWANMQANDKRAQDEFAARKAKGNFGIITEDGFEAFTTVEEWLKAERAARQKLNSEYSSAMAEYQKTEGTGFSDKARIEAKRNMLKFVIAYQYASLLQGGTGGRTISDQDVQNMLTALSQEQWLTSPEAMVESSLEIYQQASIQEQINSSLLSNDPTIASGAALFKKRLASEVDFVHEFNSLDKFGKGGKPLSTDIDELQEGITDKIIRGKRLTNLGVDTAVETIVDGKTIYTPLRRFSMSQNTIDKLIEQDEDNVSQQINLGDYIEDIKNYDEKEIENAYGMTREQLLKYIEQREKNVPVAVFPDGSVKFIMQES